MATSPAVHITRDRFHLKWDPAIPPIETVESGAVVEFDLLDASGGQLTAASTVDDLARLDFDRVDQVNGPIAVVGAEPGDTLQIDLLEFEPAGGLLLVLPRAALDEVEAAVAGLGLEVRMWGNGSLEPEGWAWALGR